METITKDSVKNHCRTCLAKFYSKEREASTIRRKVDSDDGETVTSTPHGPASDGDEEYKEIYVDITTNNELQHLIEKYIDERVCERVNDFPQSLCFGCYNHIQTFEIFRRHAQENARKLHALLLCEEGVRKVELDCSDETADAGGNVTDSTDDDDDDDESRVVKSDIYKLLLKDSLMETESIMLDNSAVAALASTEFHDPDPFSNAEPPTPRMANCDSFSQDGEDGLTIDKMARSRSSEENSSQKSFIEKNPMDTDESAVIEGEESEVYSEPSEKCITQRRHTRSSANSKKKRQSRQGKKGSCIPQKHSTENKKKAKSEEGDVVDDDLEESQGSSLGIKLKRRVRGSRNSFKCSQCNHCFAHKITLDAHVRKVHEGSKRPYQCDRCEKSYTFIGGLYTHIKEIHESEVRRYTCDYPECDRIYTSYIAMQKHKRLKHSSVDCQKKYVCERCGATFNQSGNLKHHRRTKHPTEEEKVEKERTKENYFCEICKKQFHSRYTLKYHTLQQHSDDMKFACKVCGRRMAKKFMLAQHMLVHSTDKMPCEHCGKQFIRKFELEAHIRVVHMKLKPFECQYCSECFGSRKTLRHHEYIHTGEKPYVCDICGQAYRQQTCLKNHRKSHEKLTSTESAMTTNVGRSLTGSIAAPGQVMGPELGQEQVDHQPLPLPSNLPAMSDCGGSTLPRLLSN